RAGWQELQPLVRLEGTVSGLKSPRLKVACLESSYYLQNQLLRDADWAGMAHSVEIRVPFVDVELLRKIAQLVANGMPASKVDLALACGAAFPQELLCRPKTGFCIPLHQWLARGRPVGKPCLRARGQAARRWALQVYSRFVRR